MTGTPVVGTRPRRVPLVAALTASGISLVGTRLSMIALPLFVLATTGSATRTGLVAMAEMLPYVVAQGLAGPVTDRIGPWRVSVTSDLVSAVVVGVIPLLHVLGRLDLGSLVVLVAVAGLVRGPGDGAKYLLAPGVARLAGQPTERVLGLADTMNRTSSVLGPLGAGALVLVIGAPGALALDAASFLVAGVLIATCVPRREVAPMAPDPEEAPTSYVERLRTGARFLGRDGLLRAIAGMVATTNLLDAAMSTVLIAVWARSQGGGAGLMGVVVASLGCGAVIGALTAAAVGHRLPRRATFTLGFLVGGAPRFVVLGLGAPLWVVMAVWFVGGLGAGTINPILGAVELERIPERMRASVLSLLGSAAWALIPFGGLLGGLLSDRLGVSTALLVCGGGYLVATTLPALRPEWRQMDRRTADGSEPVTERDEISLEVSKPATQGTLSA